MHAYAARLVVVDHLVGNQLGEAGFERLHTELRAGRDHIAQLRALAVADEIPDRMRGDEHFERRDAATADARDEPLRDYGRERPGQLDPDLILSVRGKH